MLNFQIMTNYIKLSHPNCDELQKNFTFKLLTNYSDISLLNHDELHDVLGYASGAVG